MRRKLVILLVLCSIFLAIGCTSNKGNNTQIPSTPAETPSIPVEGKIAEVSIKNFSFNPESVTISTGDTVRWTNMDSASHTVTGTSFGSQTLAPGDSYEFLFTNAGTYEYHCSIHPSMKGTVTVEGK